MNGNGKIYRKVNKHERQILRNKKHRALSMLHDEYASVPAAKASTNAIVISKIYYLEVLLNV